jgi:hypothetical protein
MFDVMPRGGGNRFAVSCSEWGVGRKKMMMKNTDN